MDSAGTVELGASASGWFTGEYVHTLDPKNRLTIPAEWRNAVGPEQCFYVLPDLHKSCLNLVTAAQMEVIVRQLRGKLLTNPKVKELANLLASWSARVAWDAQGRIRISDRLLNAAGIKKDVVLSAAFGAIELWSRDLREPRVNLDRAELGQLSDYMNF